MAATPSSKSIPQVTREALARNPHIRLGDPDAQLSIAALRLKIKNDPAFGRELLRKAGIVDAAGKISKNFGG